MGGDAILYLPIIYLIDYEGTICNWLITPDVLHNIAISSVTRPFAEALYLYVCIVLHYLLY